MIRCAPWSRCRIRWKTLRKTLQAEGLLAKGGHAAILPTIRALSNRLLREDRVPRTEELAVLPALADAVVNALCWNEKDPPPAALTR